MAMHVPQVRVRTLGTRPHLPAFPLPGTPQQPTVTRTTRTLAPVPQVFIPPKNTARLPQATTPLPLYPHLCVGWAWIPGWSIAGMPPRRVLPAGGHNVHPGRYTSGVDPAWHVRRLEGNADLVCWSDSAKVRAPVCWPGGTGVGWRPPACRLLAHRSRNVEIWLPLAPYTCLSPCGLVGLVSFSIVNFFVGQTIVRSTRPRRSLPYRARWAG